MSVSLYTYPLDKQRWFTHECPKDWRTQMDKCNGNRNLSGEKQTTYQKLNSAVLNVEINFKLLLKTMKTKMSINIR